MPQNMDFFAVTDGQMADWFHKNKMISYQYSMPVGQKRGFPNGNIVQGGKNHIFRTFLGS